MLALIWNSLAVIGIGAVGCAVIFTGMIWRSSKAAD